ncbi:hypothetical protein BC936DRAFT_143503 [Jimgerdemannia flammicorona]|uniref:Uncharacterized protein n=1 Tax=Jimgerdemannia flammicorona TaxID=994334 RepID=A0A432ZYX7_9FUNG|nr:hypothetical protein BC936DRAFT_143503 [Jimgerdemannia flammicorona]
MLGAYWVILGFAFRSRCRPRFPHDWKYTAAYAVEGTNIPESSAMLGGERLYFLAGLREGTVICFEWTWDAGLFSLHMSNSKGHSLGYITVSPLTSTVSHILYQRMQFILQAPTAHSSRTPSSAASVPSPSDSSPRQRTSIRNGTAIPWEFLKVQSSRCPIVSGASRLRGLG